VEEREKTGGFALHEPAVVRSKSAAKRIARWIRQP